MAELDGRVAVVTGGAGGLGRAIVEHLASSKATVVIGDVAEDADGVAQEMRAGGHDVHFDRLDVTDTECVESVVERVAARFGRIDIVVNGAGFARDRPLTSMSDDDWSAVVDTCLFGTFAVCRSVAPYMISQEYGRIVNISSRAYLGNPGQANYSAAKAGILGLTKSLAKELGRYFVTVNAIAPGVVDTPMVRGHPKFEMIADIARKGNLIPRIGSPDDVAAAVAFLCSESASFITAETIHVSGGRRG